MEKHSSIAYLWCQQMFTTQASKKKRTARLNNDVQAGLGQQPDGVGAEADAILSLVRLPHDADGQLPVRDGLAQDLGFLRLERLLEDGRIVLLLLLGGFGIPLVRYG